MIDPTEELVEGIDYLVDCDPGDEHRRRTKYDPPEPEVTLRMPQVTIDLYPMQAINDSVRLNVILHIQHPRNLRHVQLGQLVNDALIEAVKHRLHR